MSESTVSIPFHPAGDFAFLEPIRQATPLLREEARPPWTRRWPLF